MRTFLTKIPSHSNKKKEGPNAYFPLLFFCLHACKVTHKRVCDNQLNSIHITSVGFFCLFVCLASSLNRRKRKFSCWPPTNKKSGLRCFLCFFFFLSFFVQMRQIKETCYNFRRRSKTIFCHCWLPLRSVEGNTRTYSSTPFEDRYLLTSCHQLINQKIFRFLLASWFATTEKRFTKEGKGGHWKIFLPGKE